MSAVATRHRADALELRILAFSATISLISAVVGLVIAPAVLLRGSANARISLVVLVFLLATGASIILLTRIPAGASEETPRGPVRAGIAAAGVVMLGLAIINVVRSGNDVGWVDLTVLGLAAAVIVTSGPASAWLASDRRIERFASRVVTAGWVFAPHRDTRWEPMDLVVWSAGAVGLAIGLAIVLPDGPFGHDESIYALKARSWIEGTPSTGWAIYRPIGMSLVGWLVLQFSSSEVAFRSAAVVMAVAAITIMWLAGRLMYNRVSATVATAVFVGSESLLRRATEFLNDLSSAGLMLAAMVAVWYHFERRPGGWWLVAAAPFGAAAYYMRYGSALGLVIAAVVAALVWRNSLRRSVRQIAVTAIVLIALLIPHFAYSIAVTGSPIGVFESASTSVGGGGGGLSDYLRWLPASLAGPLGTALLAIAVMYLAWAITAARRDRATYAGEARTAGFLVITAISLTIALGAFTHGEPRFVYLPLMLMLLTGARGAMLVWSALRHRPRILSGVAAGVLLVVGFVAGVDHMAGALAGVTDSRDVIVGAADAVRADAGADRACEIRSTYIPQLTWYAACSTYGFGRPIPQTSPAYLVLFENGKRQPTGADLASEIEAAGPPPLIEVPDPYDKIGEGSVYRYP